MENKKKSKWSFLANLDVIVASVILALLIILTFAGVIWRYVFHAPFTWLEEVQTSCMVWITFAAAGAAFRNGNHVAIEMIVDLMPEKVQKVMEIMIAVIVVVILGFLFVHAEYRFHPGVRKERTFHQYVTYSLHCSVWHFTFFLCGYGDQFYLQHTSWR